MHSRLLKIVRYACLVPAVIAGMATITLSENAAGKSKKPSASKSAPRLISVPTDASARYYLLKRSGTSTRPILVTKRVGSSGTSYSRREFDCAAHTFRYLGDGDSIEEMNASTPDAEMSPLVDGSISDYIGRVACSGR